MRPLRAGAALLAAALFTASVAAPARAAEPPTGTWQGNLMGLRLVLHIAPSASGTARATLDSPDQGATGLPFDTLWVHGDSLVLQMARLRASYAALVLAGGDSLSGVWTQGAQSLPLGMHRADSAVTLKRPQHPRPPFPYDEERVTVPNPAAPGVTLAATVTVPRTPGPHPAAVLITGSGQQDRDETLLGHKPFAVIADYLTRRGYVVLRADDRGVGGSTGPVMTATSEDFASDAEALFAYLLGRPDVDKGRVGLIGHSEGGLIAPMVAAKDPRVAYLVLLAAPGVPGDSVLIAQGEAIRKASGTSAATNALQTALQRELFAAVRAEPDSAKLAKRLQDILRAWYPRIPADERGGITEKQFVESSSQTLTLRWMRWFITHDPRPTLAKVRCAVLALNGGKDLQVLDWQNLTEIQAWVRKSGNRNVTIRGFPALNHLFQTATTGLMSEYGRIEETFSPEVLEVIGEWLDTKARLPR